MPRIGLRARDISVLLVAGESGLRGAVTSAFSTHTSGMSLIEATSLAGACSVLATVAPDAVVFHSSLPDGSLSEFLGSLRARHPALPVFVLSSTAADAEALDATQSGATGFFSLPDGALTRLPSLIDQALHVGPSATLPVADPGHVASLRAAMAAATHDLRGPLTGLTALLSLLEDGADGPLTPAQVRRLARIRVSTERIAAIVQEMGELSLIETGRAAQRMVPIDLKDVAGGICEDLAGLARSRLIELHIKSEHGLHSVEGDPQRLPRLFRLLVMTAISTAEGPALELALTPADLGVNVSLREIRRPLPVEAMDAIGEMPDGFKRAEDAPGEVPQDQESLISDGLARALAEAIIRAHGGRILTEAGDGAAAIAAFFLPYRHVAEAAVAERPRDHHADA